MEDETVVSDAEGEADPTEEPGEKSQVPIPEEIPTAPCYIAPLQIDK